MTDRRDPTPPSAGGGACPPGGTTPCPPKRTVVQIKAKVPTTQSARGTHAVPPPRTHHEFSRSSHVKELASNAPTVLVRNSGDVELEVTTSPPNQSDVVWKVELNPGPGPEPVLTAAGTKATLKLDAAGAYSITATLDGDTVYWNLVLVEVKINSSQVFRNSTNFRGINTAAQVQVKTGDFNDADPSKCAMFVRANVELFAGGDASLDTYLDKVHVGFPQSILTMTPTGTYEGGKTERYRIDIVDRTSTGVIVDPAVSVTDLGAPSLDRGGAAATRATGGDTIFLSHTRSTPATGKVRDVQTCDSPSLPFDRLLPEFGIAATKKLTATSGSIDFTFYLVAYSDDANFTYVAFGHASWNEDFGGTVAFAGATVTWTKTTAGVTGAPSTLTKIEHGKEAREAGCEVRPPSALANVCVDAR